MEHCIKLQQVSNKKCEALTTFLRDQNSEAFLLDSLDSHSILDLLGNEGNDTGRPNSGFQNLGTDNLNLEDILREQENNSQGDSDRYAYPNTGHHLIIDDDNLNDS